MTSSFLPLLAAPAINEVISILVGISFLVLWVVNQIKDARKRQAAQQRAESNQPPALSTAADEKKAQPAVAAQAAGAPTDPLRAQVEEFMRRVAKTQGVSTPPAPAPRKPEVVVLLDETAQPPARPPLAKRPRGSQPVAARGKGQAAAPAKIKPAAAERKPPRRPQSVAEHVADHIASTEQEFRAETADLGERVRQADEQFDRQLQKKFDHELGTLAPRQAAWQEPASPAEPSPARQLAALLANPESVREAVVLGEILRRPVDSW